MNNINVSVIIPIYNAERYLNECIQSLINQKNDMIVEYIFINNGSTDNSEMICKKTVEKYENFKLLNLKTPNVSTARNVGLDYSKGTYIMFCDADDTQSQNWISYLYSTITMKEVDMAVCGYERFTSHIPNETLNHDKVLFREQRIDDLNECLTHTMIDPLFGGYLWNKIFKRSIIDKFNIRFSSEYDLLEDQNFVVEYLLHCNAVTYTKSALYFYRVSENSLSGLRVTEHRLENECAGRLDVYKKIEDVSIIDYNLKKIVWQQLMRAYVALFWYSLKRKKIAITIFIIKNFKKYGSSKYDLKNSMWGVREKIVFYLMKFITCFAKELKNE